jgi:outer membrane protein assembly factor BamB
MRRFQLFWLIGCAALAVVTTLAFAGPALSIDTGVDWLQGRHDETNTGLSPSALPASPQLLWTFSGKSKENVRLHPDSGSAIHGSVLFTSADKNVSGIQGESQSEFYAFDVATGQKLWTYDPQTPGAKHDGLVAVDVDRSLVIYPAHDGYIRALDETTGALVWSFQACDASVEVCDLEGGVTVANGRAYYVSNHYLFALDPDRIGPTVLWSFFRGALTRGVASKPAVANGMVFFGGYQHFWAVDELTGAQIWDRPTSQLDFSYGFNTPHYLNGKIYASASKSGSKVTILTAIDAATGATVWEKVLRLGFTVKSSIGYGKWFLGFWKGGGQGGLIAFDLATGKEVWRFDRVGSPPVKVGPVNGGPAVADNKVVFGASDGHIYMLDQATGNLLWSFATGETTHSAAAIAAGRFFVGSNQTFRAFGP